MSGITIKDYGRPEPPEGERTWTTEEMAAEFDVVGFAAPFVVVRRKDDGTEGVLEFTHNPRLYFSYQART